MEEQVLRGCVYCYRVVHLCGTIFKFGRGTDLSVLDKIKSFLFSPPSFEDGDKDNVARWIFIYFWLAWVTYAALWFIVIPNLSWTGEQAELGKKLIAIGAAIDVLFFIALRFGLVKFATWGHFTLIYILAVIGLFNLGGIRGPVVTFFFIFITISVTFVHERLTVVVAASSIAALGAAYFLEHAGYIEPYPQADFAPIELLLAGIIFLIVAALQTFLSIKEFRGWR